MADARLLNPNNADSPVNPSKIAGNFIGPSNNYYKKTRITQWGTGYSEANEVDGLGCFLKKDGTRLLMGIFNFNKDAEGVGNYICTIPEEFAFYADRQMWGMANNTISSQFVLLNDRILQFWPSVPPTGGWYQLTIVY